MLMFVYVKPVEIGVEKGVSTEPLKTSIAAIGLVASFTSGLSLMGHLQREDGLLFGYFETPYSFDECRARMEGTEVNARWQAMMAPYFELPLGARPDQMMNELEEVFHLA